VTEVTKEEIKKFLESNENENTTFQNLWTQQSPCQGKIIAVSTYIKKTRDLSNKQPNDAP
jgi:hypothetical protein